MEDQRKHLWKLLYSSQEVDEVISKNMKSKILRFSPPNPNRPLVIIAILKGGVWAAYKLLDVLSCYYKDIRVGHMGISSYGNGRHPDRMKITSTLDLSVEDVQDSEVWIVDDIWDTGATIRKAQDIIKLMKPAYLRTAVLVYRVVPPVAPEYPSPDVVGFQYRDTGFLAGCGMGYGELYRHFNAIYEVPEEE